MTTNSRNSDTPSVALLGAAAALVLLVAVGFDPAAEIVRKAADIPERADGLGKFVNAAKALSEPATIAMAAIAPLACIVGAGALMFGNRRGMVIIGAALGTLVFCASVTGIVA
jgi:hypothetical protein